MSKFGLINIGICLYFLIHPAYSNAQDLQKYRCFSDHQQIEGWQKAFNRSFDSNGIVIQNKRYSPLIISIFGILSYDEFIQTNDSTYYWHLVKQYNFFKDTTYCKLLDRDSKMKLIYDYKFNDLDPGWHSGMTQGTAISMVLRYFKLTNDSTALITAKQLASFMLEDEKDGGTISCTPEGYCFIEEYPNSKKSRHVFNGFINGLIGLHEYLLFFSDEEAKLIFEDSYEAIFVSLEKYDTPTWTNYNRSGKPIPEQYMRYQMSQFEHLYEMFGDQRFLDQIQIWSMMAHNRIDKSIKFYKKPDFQYAIPFTKVQIDDKELLEYKPLSNSYNSEPMNQTIDSVLYKSHSLTYNFPDHIDTVTISFDDKIKAKKLTLSNVHKNQYELIAHKDSSATFQLINIKTQRLQFTYSAKKSKSVIVRSVIAACKSKYINPHYVYHVLPVRPMTANAIYRPEISGINLNDFNIYYRFSALGDFNRNAKWSIQNKLDENGFTSESNGQIQFFLSVKTNDLPILIDYFRIVEK